MNVRPLSQEDLRPYTIPSQVVAVRLFRQKTGNWIAGILEALKLNEDAIRIYFDKFVQIEPCIDLPIDPQNPSEKLFTHFRVAKTSVSQNGIRGNDRRPIFCSDPQLIEFDAPITPTVISVRSNEHGAMILTSREEDLHDIEKLFNQLHIPSHVDKVATAQ